MCSWSDFEEVSKKGLSPIGVGCVGFGCISRTMLGPKRTSGVLLVGDVLCGLGN